MQTRLHAPPGILHCRRHRPIRARWELPCHGTACFADSGASQSSSSGASVLSIARRFVVPGVIVVGLSAAAVACGGSRTMTALTRSASGGSGHHASARRACDSAIYTISVPKGHRPRALNARIIGAAIFNDLKAARGTPASLDLPTSEEPFYIYKSPLTVWGRPTVRVTIIAPRDNARLIYDPRLVSQGRLRWSELTRTTTFAVCSKGAQQLATQYNGGFVLRHPGCVTIRAQGIAGQPGDKQTVPFGVKECAPTTLGRIRVIVK